MATDELMTLDQIKESVALLRLRRASIPEMREYKPQAKGKAKKAIAPERDIISVLLTSNKALQIEYQPESEAGKRAKALLGGAK